VILYRVFVSLTKNGFKDEAFKFEGHESKSTYVLSRGEKSKIHHVKKTKLMQLDNGMFLISHTSIHYLTWCMPEQIEEAKKKCKEAVIRQALIIKEEATPLFKYLEK